MGNDQRTFKNIFRSITPIDEDLYKLARKVLLAVSCTYSGQDIEPYQRLLYRRGIPHRVLSGAVRAYLEPVICEGAIKFIKAEEVKGEEYYLHIRIHNYDKSIFASLDPDEFFRRNKELLERELRHPNLSRESAIRILSAKAPDHKRLESFIKALKFGAIIIPRNIHNDDEDHKICERIKNNLLNVRINWRPDGFRSTKVGLISLRKARDGFKAELINVPTPKYATLRPERSIVRRFLENAFPALFSQPQSV